MHTHTLSYLFSQEITSSGVCSYWISNWSSWHWTHTGVAKQHQWPTNKAKRKHTLKKPIKIMFMPRNSLGRHLLSVINSDSSPFLPCCLSSFSPYKPIYPCLKKKKKYKKICGFQSLRALSPCLVSIPLSLHLSPPLLPLNLPETSNFHFRVHLISLLLTSFH